jgi:hypothetical protein
VLINFPDGTQVVVPFKEDTKLLDLLPRIHKTKRLRLYTNEYVFAVSAGDQKRLKVKPSFVPCAPLMTLTKYDCTAVDVTVLGHATTGLHAGRHILGNTQQVSRSLVCSSIVCILCKLHTVPRTIFVQF